MLQLKITSNRLEISKLREVFNSSYTRVCGEQTDNYFEKIMANCTAASIITKDGEPYAFSFHRQIICSNWQNPPEYMKDTPDFFRKRIENLPLMTVEWATVAPKFLGVFSKTAPVDLIFGCCVKLLLNSYNGAIIGYSRQDNRTDLLTTRFGSTLNGTVKRFNDDCSVVLVEAVKVINHKIPKTQEKINDLWANRINNVPNIERAAFESLVQNA